VVDPAAVMGQPPASMSEDSHASNDDAEPEYATIDAFAEYLVDDERSTYRPSDLVKLMRRTRLSREAVAAALADYGLMPDVR
jgi:hypothetical protein